MPEVWYEQSDVYVNTEYWVYQYECHIEDGYKVVTLCNKWRR